MESRVRRPGAARREEEEEEEEGRQDWGSLQAAAVAQKDLLPLALCQLMGSFLDPKSHQSGSRICPQGITDPLWLFAGLLGAETPPVLGPGWETWIQGALRAWRGHGGHRGHREHGGHRGQAADPGSESSCLGKELCPAASSLLSPQVPLPRVGTEVELGSIQEQLPRVLQGQQGRNSRALRLPPPGLFIDSAKLFS